MAQNDEIRRLLARRTSMLAARGRGRGTPTTTPTRPPPPTRTPGPTAGRATAPSRATPSRPESAASSLSRLAEAFSPEFVLPEDLRGQRTKAAITKTAQAAQAISRKRGVSFQEAASILRTVGAQIKKAKKLRTQLLKKSPGLSEKEQIRFLRGGGLSAGTRRSVGAFVPREIAGFVVLSDRKR